MNILGKRIKTLRESENINQKDFAKTINVSNVVLSRYETGERKPDYDTLLSIAKYFGVTTDYLLGKSDSRHLSASDEDEIDEEIKDITSRIKIWHKNEPKDKESKLRILRKVVESFEEDE